MAENEEQHFPAPKQPKAAQHAAVLDAAATNLDTLRDQIDSLGDPKYDDLLETLDRAHEEMQRLRGA
jgi:hypothetical protein